MPARFSRRTCAAASALTDRIIRARVRTERDMAPDPKDARRRFMIAGEHVILRAFEREDAERCYRWMNDPNIVRTLKSRYPIAFSNEVEWLDRAMQPAATERHFAIERKDDRAHIGNASSHDIDWVSRNAWFGLFITSLNLLPIGQLDGGHVAYAMWGPRQRSVAVALVPILMLFGWLGWKGWFLWVGLVGIMGLAHPPVQNPDRELGGARLMVGWMALAIFAITFSWEPFVLR